jgi:ribosomal protein S18 acetylase RimI-like enzyme
MDAFPIRAATLADLEIICHHRRRMFEDMGRGDAESLARMIAAFALWVQPKLESGEYLAWLSESADGAVVAGAGLWLMDWPPHLLGAHAGGTPGGRQPRGNVLNVYTEPAFRGRGLARSLMLRLMEECRRRDVGAVVLHSSEQGRPLYESLGFAPTNEMRLLL